MNEETARALIAALNRLSVAIDRLTLPDYLMGLRPPFDPAVSMDDYHRRAVADWPKGSASVEVRNGRSVITPIIE